ncbi:MAG: NAD-dependent epimerase/dehydratase family protein [Candidatus Sericytochromatia bacterium]|nr:NAD-dependent epimerase/dehydratase family protein [Candidatus Tanganyikabacteria bacterium]
MKTLVVGGAGFVGSNLVRRLLADGAGEIVVVDNLLSSERESLPADPRIRLIEGSITDDAILGELADEYSVAYHLATFHGNQNSMHDPLADHENNTLTSLKLFQRLKGFRRLEKVVYASAGCTVALKTYDEARPTTEDDPVSLYLDSPYQISKIIGEFYANYYWTRHDLPVVKARFQNVYGPGEVLGAGKWRGTPATIWRNVIPTFVYRSLKGMPLHLDNAGESTRDFIFVADLVEGLVRCADRGERGGVYNLAAGAETRILDLARMIDELTGNPSPPVLGPRRDWDHSGRRLGSTEKAESALGFRGATSLPDGLATTVAWTRDNLAFIERCMDRHAARAVTAD